MILRFNPRARVGRDGTHNSLRTVARRFNPRARVGRDWISRPWPRHFDVSIHAPAWGATCWNSGRRNGSSGFNPRARVGRDANIRMLPVQHRFVSIHAPAWGATPRVHRRRPVHAVSIHAPAWGATGRPGGQGARRASFNPRARVGRDEIEITHDTRTPWFQSTRPRGARLRSWKCIPPTQGFNPRARVGRDLFERQMLDGSVWFQSTRPRGARRRRPDTDCRGTQRFNPRARVGRDTRPQVP